MFHYYLFKLIKLKCPLFLKWRQNIRRQIKNPEKEITCKRILVYSYKAVIIEDYAVFWRAKNEPATPGFKPDATVCISTARKKLLW